ncbi:MAG: helix-turn-helix domain-containing protein [Selenomonadaceae bacterium]
MSNTYNMIKSSLDELITDLKENDGKNLTTTTLKINITPIKTYSGTHIREIRIKNSLTQVVLAKYLGVSKKTIEAWESNKNKPNGPSSRLLEMIDNHMISIIS